MKGELRRKQILEVSKKVFSANGGYYETHVEEVIRTAKIGKGTFYQYFKNKEELFLALLDLFLEEWEEAVVSQYGAADQVGSADFLRALVGRTIEFFYRNEYVTTIYLGGGIGFGPQFAAHIDRFEEKMLDHVRRLLQQGIASKRLRRDLDIDLVANYFLGAILRVIYYSFVVKKEQHSAAELDEMSQTFFDVAMGGIAV